MAEHTSLLDPADEEALENAINYCRGAPLPDELVAGLERLREKLRWAR